MSDMESLQKAETALEDLQVLCINMLLNVIIILLFFYFLIIHFTFQKELEKAKQVQENVISEKINLEKQLQEKQIKDLTSSDMKSSYSDLEISQLKNEIEVI